MPRQPDAFAYTPNETWSFNGTALQDPHGSWNITTMGGSRFSVPVVRGQNISVPYRAGQAQRAKWPDQRTITLTMWVDGQGSFVAGQYPATDQRLAFNNNLQQIRQLFYSRGGGGSQQGLLQRNWYLTQGTNKLITATAMAEIAGSMDLTMNGRTNAGFSVDLLLNDPYFYGAQQVVGVTSAGATLTGLGEGVVGEGWPSSVSSFTVSLTAATTVMNTTAGVGFTYTGAGSPTYPVVVDILNQTVIDNGGVNQIAGLTHTGSRLWMCLLNGSNTITNSAGTATFTWNDAYI